MATYAAAQTVFFKTLAKREKTIVTDRENSSLIADDVLFYSIKLCTLFTL
jgi:hypothetical protein